MKLQITKPHYRDQIFSLKHPTWGEFRYDLSDVWDYIELNNVQPKPCIGVNQWAESCNLAKSKLNPDRGVYDQLAKDVDLKYPLIVVTQLVATGEIKPILIDGLHRLRKAYPKGN
jgi:hypothetical protein